MSTPPADDPSSPRACLSGLRRDRCCGFDWSTPQAEPQQAPEIDRARDALAAGDVAAATRLGIDLLERFRPRYSRLRHRPRAA